ncbi:hypothetical protein HG535_0G00560 [Zygotorulaspora mrakii]|uniref:WLM domain-containing protein n=1 Tax=Zygotorulaspora mrakii TaxID=42260 RepID=A0A7H9B8V7_ZYGMR|nr:uncharacterized protein HG535_0G00560 [Zygotorulaspora mrakii]QLG74172.1 hypothetical protein HG535_0G00560 [Zygotorulaspora mrakii]
MTSGGTGAKNPHVKELAVLQRLPNKGDALEILGDIAHRVSYLMKEHQFKVNSLVEFYPKDKRLLGMNVNRGMKIMLRLRNPHDEYQFLPRESIIGTMLHELTHNLFGPHDNKFYKKLDDLIGRQWVIEQQGLFDTFLGSGKRLGGQSVRGRRAVNSVRISKLCGTRLGSGSNEAVPKLSPRELAAKAAIRRANDSKWCHDNDDRIVESLIPKAKDLHVIIVDEDVIDDDASSTYKPEIIDLT